MFALISLLNVSCPTKPLLIDTLQIFLFGKITRPSQIGLQWCMIDNMKVLDVRSMLKL